MRCTKFYVLIDFDSNTVVAVFSSALSEIAKERERERERVEPESELGHNSRVCTIGYNQVHS